MTLPLIRKPTDATEGGELNPDNDQTIAGNKTFTGVIDPSGGFTGSGGLADPSNAGIVVLLDEDDMSSDSSTKASSQQSIKAYIDAQNLTVVEGRTDTGTLNLNITTGQHPSIYVKFTNGALLTLQSLKLSGGATPATGTKLYITRSGGFNVDINHDSGGGAAGGKFISNISATITLGANDGATFVHDGTYWRQIAVGS